MKNLGSYAFYECPGLIRVAVSKELRRSLGEEFYGRDIWYFLDRLQGKSEDEETKPSIVLEGLDQQSLLIRISNMDEEEFLSYFGNRKKPKKVKPPDVDLETDITEWRRIVGDNLRECFMMALDDVRFYRFAAEYGLFTADIAGEMLELTRSVECRAILFECRRKLTEKEERI